MPEDQLTPISDAGSVCESGTGVPPVNHAQDGRATIKLKQQPISLPERIGILDVLRGLAVCGILIGNMQWFSGYGMMPPAMARHSPFADQLTHFLVHFFVEGKFYSIFSFLFGFGFALQIARAAERGGWMYRFQPSARGFLA